MNVWWWAVAAAAPVSGPTAAPSELVAGPADALEPLARRWWDEGTRLESQGQWAAAALRYRAVREADPAWAEAVVALGRVLAADGRDAEAEQAWNDLPYDADAVEALGRHQLARLRPGEAADTFARLRVLRPEWPGTRLLEARALAGHDPVAAAGRISDYLGFDGIAPGPDELTLTALEVGSALRAAGLRDEAAALVAEVLARDPDSAGPLAGLLAEIEVDLVAAELEAAVDAPLDAEQRARVRSAREVFAAGDRDRARRELEVLAMEQPASAVIWSALADVRLATGDPVGAEQALVAAARLDPRDADTPARHGALLEEHFGGRFDHEAARAWARAVRRRPDDPELWYRRAQAERRTGNWRLYVWCLQQVAALDPEGAHADEARTATLGVSLQRVEGPPPPSVSGRPASVPEAAWTAWHRAWAWRERPEEDAADRALEELATTRRLAPDFVPALDLEAGLRLDRDEVSEATALLDRALELAPERGDLAWRASVLHARAGDAERARALRDRAAAAGDPSALLALATEQAAGLRWWEARATLAAFFARTSGGPGFEQARALDAALAARTRWTTVGVGAVALLAPLPALGWWARTRRGASVAELVARAPQTAREVAAICSALRHEVLKHHLGVLDAVADALDDRDPEPARWAAERWFGPEGALARADGYLEGLRDLGARVGVPLNLDRDPDFGPLVRGVARLRRLEPRLRSGHGRALAEELRGVSAVLADEAWRALGRLVDGWCLLRVDERVWSEVWERTAAEFPDRPLPVWAVEVADGELWVRMFRPELDDLLINLVRNAIEASPEGGRIGLFARAEEDEITGLERVLLAVADDAGHGLTTARLRSRWLSRGLGLAVELAGRAGGAIEVRRWPGYDKAVVVTLPRVELGGEDG